MITDREMKIAEAAPELKPCPFCGAGETRVIANVQMWTGKSYGEPVSVSVRHWCTPVSGQPSRMIERIGRDRESAIAAWNMRAAIARKHGAEDAAREMES